MNGKREALTSNPVSVTPEEAGRLIHLRNELVNMVEEWKKHGWGTGLAARFKAMAKTLANEPTPSPGYQNLSKRRSLMTQDEAQTILNGALLALAWRAGGVVQVDTHDIYQAHSDLGTLSVAISDDDATITVTGTKAQ